MSHTVSSRCPSKSQQVQPISLVQYAQRYLSLCESHCDLKELFSYHAVPMLQMIYINHPMEASCDHHCNCEYHLKVTTELNLKTKWLSLCSAVP
uniref:Uncharacterized protein MANES_06G116700 n=1 Tax=Rhizophora mucronata TaxID=61149 RepID=A0A2P2KL26_RHIMU